MGLDLPHKTYPMRSSPVLAPVRVALFTSTRSHNSTPTSSRTSTSRPTRLSQEGLSFHLQPAHVSETPLDLWVSHAPQRVVVPKKTENRRSEAVILRVQSSTPKWWLGMISLIRNRGRSGQQSEPHRIKAFCLWNICCLVSIHGAGGTLFCCVFGKSIV
jgi:hypothetical protein